MPNAWGLDRLPECHRLLDRLRAGKCGVLTHAAAVNRKGRQTVTVLKELGVAPELVFTPEHGFSGIEQAEEAVTSGGPVGEGGVPMISLYGSRKSSLTPAAGHLSGLTSLVIDLVDIGARYYTFVWSALLAARAARAQGIHTLVLDRPNPLSGDATLCEGKRQQPGFTSFVGLEPIPVRHGLTIGELLVFLLQLEGATLGPGGALSVVTCQGWERNRTAAAWGRPFIPPSPNMPNLETALLYPGGCLIEGTNLSEGRGTCFPFRVVGAPFLDGERLARDVTALPLRGALVRPVAFRPTFDKFAGQVCQGVMIHVVDETSFRPVSTYLSLLALARAQAPESFALRTDPYEFETEIPAIDLLTGSSDARMVLTHDDPLDDLLAAVVPVDGAWTDVVQEAEAALRTAAA